MYGEGRELLRAHIKSKRACEGLEEIPDDLFAKKPKYDLSAEEQDRLLERRQRNKEAAEKSRKKKKEEYEKLQIENDQLNQDKCELVGMVEELKKGMHELTEENKDLRSNNDQLKRWIGKRASELGLFKYCEKKNVLDKPKVNGFYSLGSSPLTHGDPFLQSPDKNKEQVSDTKSPSSSPEISSSPPPVLDTIQSQNIHTSVRPQLLQTPWLVEQPSMEQKKVLAIKKADLISNMNAPRPSPPPHAIQPPASQSFVTSGGQQIVCLPNNMVLIFPDENGQRLVAGAPEVKPDPVMQQVVVVPEEAQASVVPDSTASTLEDLHGDVKESQAAGNVAQDATAASDTTAALDTDTTTAIESLLKLGYKIGMPKPADDKGAQHAKPEPVEMNDSSDYFSDSDAMAATVGDGAEANTNSHQVNKRYQLDIHKLIEAGYAVPMPSVSPSRANDIRR